MDPLRLRIARMISRVVRWAEIANTGTDADPYPTQRVNFLGKEGNAQTWYPYGFNALAPRGSLGLMLAIGGDSGSQVVLPGSPQERVKVLAGEVVVYHPQTKAKVHMKTDGSISIDAPVSVDVTAPTINATATATANVTAPAIGMTGAVAITGTLAVSGISNFTGDATFVGAINATSSVDASYNLAEHVHLSNFATGPGDVDPPKD